MFKSLFKRLLLSITRKPSRTIILTIILFVMAVLMLATIAIQNAVTESVNYAKESLSGTVYLQADMGSLRKQAMGDPGANAESAQPAQIERPTISVDMVEGIADSEYIKDYTYSIQTSGDAVSYATVETESQRMRSQIQENMNDDSTNTGRGSMMGGTNPGGMFEFNSGDTTIVGINSFAFISEVESGNMTLASGEIFDETTDNGVMISADLATENGLSVGDVININTTADEAIEKTLTILGTYDSSNENYDPNIIYTNIETAAPFLSDADYNDGNYNVQNVKYFLTNAEYKEAFVAEASGKYPNLTDDGLMLDIDDSAYQQMVGPIESVGSFATTIFWIVLVAAVVIIALIVTINIKDRRYEMGVLISIGATKKNIIGQISLELVIIGTVAFLLSIVPSSFIAGVMGDTLLADQVSMSQESQQQNFGRGQNASGPSRGNESNGSGVPSMGGGMMSSMFGGNSSQTEAIDEINVSPDAVDYLMLFAIGYGIIILAMIVPAGNVLRFEPKTILTGKE